jgi:ectoine hydroxylase-related dioxygenase (phytanoyl-CoA dioxygenase family)
MVPDMRTHPAPTIAPAELAAARTRGYHIVRGLVPPTEVAALRDRFMEAAEDGPVTGLSLVPPATAAGDPLARWPRMMHPHASTSHPDLARATARWLLDPGLLGILQALMEDEPVAVQSMFYFKPPGARGQDFHQDDFYLRVEPGSCWAAWIAIDPADPGNGGLAVVPGSHRLPVLAPDAADLRRSMATERVVIPAGMAAEPTHLAAGDALCFHGRLIHGSEPNRSPDRFRRSLIFHYAPVATTAIAAPYLAVARRADGRPSAWRALEADASPH